ncbi:hypothetical protein [Pseudohoeflea coraliihabitans]|uniref:Uncharacterized protein n=1 Tax=Pseudohoeflea coraliihabitans TaxID=2860393 RepID=A0ABS6WKW3_9HYPH|nr:hypothetical protein [Pseudohoeflea sp. DP4N28-3]MBW3096520.1 hypothetical protein [Pseudohoeflea sp. DP4N28-3]
MQTMAAPAQANHPPALVRDALQRSVEPAVRPSAAGSVPEKRVMPALTEEAENVASRPPRIERAGSILMIRAGD